MHFYYTYFYETSVPAAQTQLCKYIGAIVKNHVNIEGKFNVTLNVVLKV
jgi:hypothetical protein